MLYRRAALGPAQAAVMAAEDLSILPKEGQGGGGLVGVLDVGGRSAQCSIIDTAGTAEVVYVWLTKSSRPTGGARYTATLRK